MVLVEVIPSTKLPLGTPQRYTYQSAAQLSAGQAVSVSLGNRTLSGIVAGVGRTLPAGVRAKPARALTWRLPPAYLALVSDLARTYRISEGLIVKLMTAPSASAKGVTKKSKRRAAEPKAIARAPAGVPTLNTDQGTVAEQLVAALGSSKRFLLDGVTGSGKSEVYAHVAERVLDTDGQALLLVPEIAIAAHLVERLKKYLGERVVVWHSALKPAERQAVWQRAVLGEPLVLVGPRSALFVPMPKLGLIILDEEHEASYKQWDQEPRFHARTVASRLASFARCPLVLGSATPSIETISAVGHGLVQRLEMPKRFGGAVLPSIELVDTRGGTASSLVAPATLEALSDTLQKGRQSIVLINRRGTAPVVMCATCGYIWRCTKCERALVAHMHPRARLACHYCEIVSPLPRECSECGSVELKFVGAGTQRIEAELRSVFPEARIGRLDADVSRSRKRLAEVSDSLTSGVTDILVGTQLVAKSWDVERLHLVVVLNADQGLLVPDVRAHERTVQLLWQVAGRAGRRGTQGRVLIETARPDHPVLHAVVKQNYQAFLQQELAERKRYGYPPFRRAVTFHKEKSSQPEREAAELARTLALQGRAVDPSLAVLPGSVSVLPGGDPVARVTCLSHKPEQLYQFVPLAWSVDLDPESF